MRRMHGLFHRLQQMIGQVVQFDLDFAAMRRTCRAFFGVISRAIEPTVDELL